MRNFIEQKKLMSIEFQSVRKQEFCEFIYDQFYSKYGITKLVEKKYAELLFTLHSKQEHSECKLML